MVTTATKWRIGAVHLKNLDDEKVDIAELSAADPDPGSCAFLTPGSGIRKRFFQDPGSRISYPGSQTHIFESLVSIFWVKSSIIL
jgi:hypothetical protein